MAFLAQVEAARHQHWGVGGVLAFSLKRGRMIVALLLFFALALTVYVAAVIRVVLAETWGKSGQVIQLRRAIALDPRNPELHCRLGNVYLMTQLEPEPAVREFREAVRLNPDSSFYWLGLGQGCFVSGDRKCADEAIERAARLSPNNPDYAWAAVLYYVTENRRPEAIPHCKTYLKRASQPSRIFPLLVTSPSEAGSVWQDLVGPTQSADLQMKYLDFLVGKKEFETIAKCWAQLAASNLSIQPSVARPFLEHLAQAGQYEQLALVWRYMVSSGAVPGEADNRKDELLYNGEFEYMPANMGLDWRLHEQHYIRLNLDHSTVYRGRHSLAVEFTVPRDQDYELVSQIVTLAPSTTYQLSAYARSEEITSESGPRLRVQDVECPTCLDKVSEVVTGTTDWHPITLQFTTGPSTKAVSVSLWRARARTFPMEISGRFWLDSVSLKSVLASTNSSQESR